MKKVLIFVIPIAILAACANQNSHEEPHQNTIISTLKQNGYDASITADLHNALLMNVSKDDILADVCVIASDTAPTCVSAWQTYATPSDSDQRFYEYPQQYIAIRSEKDNLSELSNILADVTLDTKFDENILMSSWSSEQIKPYEILSKLSALGLSIQSCEITKDSAYLVLSFGTDFYCFTMSAGNTASDKINEIWTETKNANSESHEIIDLVDSYSYSENNCNYRYVLHNNTILLATVTDNFIADSVISTFKNIGRKE